MSPSHPPSLEVSILAPSLIEFGGRHALGAPVVSPRELAVTPREHSDGFPRALPWNQAAGRSLH